MKLRITDLKAGMRVRFTGISAVRRIFTTAQAIVIRRSLTLNERVWVLEDDQGYRQAVWLSDEDLELVSCSADELPQRLDVDLQLEGVDPE